jgi:hypothetical protein
MWEYKPPTNLDLAIFMSIYSIQHTQLRHLKTTPVRIERMIANDPIFRRSALNIHRKFCYEMGLEIVKEDPGVSCQHITDRLGDVTVEQVSNALAHLRRTHQIVNLGKHARGASWYPKDK